MITNICYKTTVEQLNFVFLYNKIISLLGTLVRQEYSSLVTVTSQSGLKDGTASDSTNAEGSDNLKYCNIKITPVFCKCVRLLTEKSYAFPS